MSESKPTYVCCEIGPSHLGERDRLSKAASGSLSMTINHIGGQCSPSPLSAIFYSGTIDQVRLFGKRGKTDTARPVDGFLLAKPSPRLQQTFAVRLLPVDRCRTRSRALDLYSATDRPNASGADRTGCNIHLDTGLAHKNVHVFCTSGKKQS